MNWFLLTILSALFSACTKLLQRVLIVDQTRDPAALAFVFQFTVSLLFFIFSIATGTFEIPDLSSQWMNVVVMALLYGVGNIFTFKAFQLAEASEVTIIFATSSIWSVLAAMLLLGEQPKTVQFFGVALIAFGVAITNIRKSKWQLNKGHIFGLLAALCFGVAFTYDALLMNSYHSVSSYMVLAFGLPSLVVLLLSPKSIKTVPVFLQPSVLPKLTLSATFYALSAITFFTAYKMGGPASVIAPVSQASIIFTVGLSYWLLKERDHTIAKILGTLVTFGGVLLML